MTVCNKFLLLKSCCCCYPFILILKSKFIYKTNCSASRISMEWYHGRFSIWISGYVICTTKCIKVIKVKSLLIFFFFLNLNSFGSVCKYKYAYIVVTPRLREKITGIEKHPKKFLFVSTMCNENLFSNVKENKIIKVLCIVQVLFEKCIV